MWTATLPTTFIVLVLPNGELFVYTTVLVSQKTKLLWYIYKEGTDWVHRTEEYKGMNWASTGCQSATSIWDGISLLQA